MSNIDKYWANLPLYATTHIKADLDNARSSVQLIEVCHKYIIVLEETQDDKVIHSISMVILPLFEILTGKNYELIVFEES